MSEREVYIVSACRTPLGDLGGAFKTVRAVDLAVVAAQAAIERAGIEKNMVEDVIWGECHQQLDQCNTARVMAMKAGLPVEIPGVTINKVCTSAMRALIFGTQQIRLGDSDIILAGGVESMSSAPYVLRTARWGQRLQHGQMSDTIWEGFTCAVANILMGLTAENLAEKYNITREQQDEVALRSQQCAVNAIKTGRFKDEIVPVPVPQRKADPIMVDTDEHPRDGLTMEALAKLPTVFKKDGTVTAANASGINDGSAAMILMSGEKMKELGLNPLAKITSYSMTGVEAELMGYGPVPATQQILKKTGLTVDDIDLWEINEAFAAQYIACEKLLELDREKVNVNGSGIALGHPVGCTGTRITVTLLHEMIKRDAKRGLATLCGMGGVATGILIER
ncbi:acetyl-CoA C-acetyltransferase [Spirochaetota bacterium]